MNIMFESDDNDSNDIELLYMYDDELSMTQSASDCASSVDNCPESPQSPYRQKARSLRKSLLNALASPVKKARGSISHTPLSSPNGNKQSPSKSLRRLKGHSNRNISFTNRNDDKTWQEKLKLPPNTTRDQAMAVLICRELEMLDI